MSKVVVDTWGGRIDGGPLDVRKGIVSPWRRNDPHLIERGMGSRFTIAGHPEVVDHETRDERGRIIRTIDRMMNTAKINIIVSVRTDANTDDVMGSGKMVAKMRSSIISAMTGIIRGGVRWWSIRRE